MKAPEKLISTALRKLMREPYPGDKLGRTGAELLALAMFKAGVDGSHAAAALICDRLEGKCPDKVEISEPREPGETLERILRLQEKLKNSAGTIQ